MLRPATLTALAILALACGSLIGLARAGSDFASLLTLGPYLAHVHVKNARWFPVKTLPDGTVSWKADWAPLSKGSADLRELFAALEHIGYDDWISVEDFSTDRPLDERLQANLDYLTALWIESVAVTPDDAPLADASPVASPATGDSAEA